MNFEPLLPALIELNCEPIERVGFILKSGEIVEVENICHEPGDGFEVRGEDLIRYEDEVLASWHTHPDQDSQLSANDYYGFRAYPEWRHIIIGDDGIRTYLVEQGVVIEDQFFAN